MPAFADRPIVLEAPTVGDLLYFPLSKGLFEIKIVEPFNVFFQQGKLYTYQMSCELFKYSMESINTGNTEIDKVEDDIVAQYGSDSAPDKYFMDIKTKNDNFELVQII
jgi:hypothetical protein